MADFYTTLWLKKDATSEEIKRAYRKIAMESHPDRNPNDKKAETRFKAATEAYETLSDAKKRKEYDTFGATWDVRGRAGANPFGGGFGGFGQNGGRTGRTYTSSSSGFHFDFDDIFGASHQASPFEAEYEFGQKAPEAESLDITKQAMIPLVDFLLWTKLSIEAPDGKRLTLSVPECTKPGTRFRIAGRGKSVRGKMGDLYVVVQAKMPKKLSPEAKTILEQIKHML